jgi:hypothetical protein
MWRSASGCRTRHVSNGARVTNAPELILGIGKLRERAQQTLSLAREHALGARTR